MLTIFMFVLAIIFAGIIFCFSIVPLDDIKTIKTTKTIVDCSRADIDETPSGKFAIIYGKDNQYMVTIDITDKELKMIRKKRFQVMRIDEEYDGVKTSKYKIIKMKEKLW